MHVPEFAKREIWIPVLVKRPISRAVFWLFAGLLLQIVGSRLLVWGAIEFTHIFCISDMVIGLTIIAIGTSLSELASSVIAAFLIVYMINTTMGKSEV